MATEIKNHVRDIGKLGMYFIGIGASSRRVYPNGMIIDRDSVRHLLNLVIIEINKVYVEPKRTELVADLRELLDLELSVTSIGAESRAVKSEATKLLNDILAKM